MKTIARAVVREVWGLDGHRLAGHVIGQKDKNIAAAAAQLLHEDFFLLSGRDEDVSN